MNTVLDNQLFSEPLCACGCGLPAQKLSRPSKGRTHSKWHSRGHSAKVPELRRLHGDRLRGMAAERGYVMKDGNVDIEEFRRLVALARKECRSTTTSISKQSGISRNTLNTYLYGKRNRSIPAEKARAILDAATISAAADAPEEDMGDPPLCKCGCGLPCGTVARPRKGGIKWSEWADPAHANRVKGWWKYDPDFGGSAPLCACGCGTPTEKYARQSYRGSPYKKWVNRDHATAYMRRLVDSSGTHIHLDDFSRAFCKIRDDHNWTNTEAAQKAHISYGHMCSLLYDRRVSRIRKETAERIFRAMLGLPFVASKRQQQDRERVQDARRGIERTYGIR